jgi:2-polyprenyl-3-methyl-5-hydroxy-6-metoxy-1,4-benzoquinol methylase
MTMCPLCGGRAVRRFELAHTSVWKCTAGRCALQFANPQLDEDALARAYAKHYYPSNGNGSEPTYENTPEEILRQTFSEALAKFGPLTGKKLLDLGCGIGGLCQVAQEYGIHTTGIESDPTARLIACKSRGLRVHANFEELRKAEPGATFDLVTMWDVVEHLREPWKAFEDLSKFLKPGGWLLLSTPNASSLRAVLERERWSNTANPTHFYYFTRRSLQAVLERSGFPTIHEWRFPMRYPSHSITRQIVNRGLWACGMHGQLLFIARPRTIEPAGSSESGDARAEVVL